MCGQTHRSPNRSFSKPQYSTIRYLFTKFNHGDETDTFFRKFKKRVDEERRGGSRTGRLFVSEVLEILDFPDFQFGF